MALSTAAELINAPLLYKGKVRELYDLGEHFLIVVTDRISAFDYVLEPAVPEKGNVLNTVSAFWFDQTKEWMPNHVVHTNVEELGDIVLDKEALRDRIMVTKKPSVLISSAWFADTLPAMAGDSINPLEQLTGLSFRKDFVKMRSWISRSSRRRPRTM